VTRLKVSYRAGFGVSGPGVSPQLQLPQLHFLSALKSGGADRRQHAGTLASCTPVTCTRLSCSLALHAVVAHLHHGSPAPPEHAK